MAASEGIRGRRGDARTLDARGYPIGVGPGSYEEERYAIAPGDRVYAYSDGFTEAASPSGAMFGFPRMLDVLTRARGESLDDSLHVLTEGVRGWTGSSEREDDQTVLAIKRVE